MCTVVLSLEPGERMPLLLLGIRDELTDRPWRPPARHWPGSPLVGGIDEQAGGTWLAVDPDLPRVACLLNARGTKADLARRHSRGELPLRAAAEGPGYLKELAEDPSALAAYDPFHLICATPDAVTELTWLGAPASPSAPPADPPQPAQPPAAQPIEPTQPVQPPAAQPPAAQPPRPGGLPVVRHLGPGTHLFTNAGHAYPPDPAHPDDPADEPKAAKFAAKFAAARPVAGPTLPPADAWGTWLTLAAGDGLARTDPAAIIVGRDLPDGHVYGTTSLTLVALAPDALRYDFQPTPGNVTSWYPVNLA